MIGYLNVVKRFAAQRDPDYCAAIRQLPCLLRGPECWGSTEVAHIKSRGAGGSDRGNVVPLCQAHHARQHRMGIVSFAERYKVNLQSEAKRIERETKEGAR